MEYSIVEWRDAGVIEGSMGRYARAPTMAAIRKVMGKKGPRRDEGFQIMSNSFQEKLSLMGGLQIIRVGLEIVLSCAQHLSNLDRLIVSV
jgi:hypothetical protein